MRGKTRSKFGDLKETDDSVDSIDNIAELLSHSGKLIDDYRRIHDFIDADFLVGEIFPLYFCERLHPQKLKLFLAIMISLGKH